jgi:hypothetical protein
MESGKAALVLLIAGCCALPPSPGSAEPQTIQMEDAKALLRQVTRYVDAALEDDPAAQILDGEELVRWSLRRKPKLVPLLGDYRIIARRSLTGREAIVLLCDRRTNLALFEDATCTRTVERERAAIGRQQACEFTLRSEDVCGIK